MKAILLDAAGTLFDLAEPVGVTYARFGKRIGLTLNSCEVENNFRQGFQSLASPNYQTSPDGEVVERNWWRELVRLATQPEDETTLDALFDPLFHYYEDPSAWKLYPDTLPFLKEAQKDFRLGVLSNFDRRLFSILQGLGLSSFFEIVVSSSEARAQKPDGKIFQLAIEKLALPASETLHIGDSRKADYEGAQASGLRAIHLQREKGDILSLNSVKALT